MRVDTAPAVGTLRGDEPLGAVLSPAHDAWVEEARQLLVPAVTPEAPFWDRWSVVRYLNDRFLERFRVERALVSELRPFVSIREMDMLETGGERVARLHLTLDRIGRRRGTAAEFAAMTTEFLDALELWCVEIEFAGGHVHRDVLTLEGPADAGAPGGSGTGALPSLVVQDALGRIAEVVDVTRALLRTA